MSITAVLWQILTFVITNAVKKIIPFYTNTHNSNENSGVSFVSLFVYIKSQGHLTFQKGCALFNDKQCHKF